MDIKIFGQNTGSGVDTTNPSDVTGLTKGTITNDAIPLSWNAASDNVAVTNYEIWESVSGGAYSLKTTLGNVLIYANTGLIENTLYAYKVKAKDAAGNTSTSFSGIVTDTTLYDDQTAPTLNSITIEDANPTNVVMVFDEAVTGTNLGFTIGGTTSTTFASISGSGTTWTGVLATAVKYGQTITLSYASGTGDFKDSSNNDLASITNQSVTNNVAINLGSELTVNGTFDTDVASWVGTEFIWVSGGSCRLTRDVVAASMSQNVGLVTSTNYLLTFDILEVNDVILLQWYDGAAYHDIDIPTVQSYEFEFTAQGGWFILQNKTGSSNVVIDNISIKEIL